MNMGVKTALAAAAVLVTAGLGASTASAMPVAGLDTAVAASAGAQVDNVRWVCGPFGCHWAPNRYYWGPRYHRYYGPRFYGPRFYGRRWGYRRW